MISGAARSTPSAGDPTTDLAVNTTGHLVSDIELLRRHLDIERWLVLGGSWGSTLGLQKAARDWCDWEETHVRVRTDQQPDARFEDAAFRMCFARLVTHYWRHAAWLDEGVLPEGVERLHGIPGVLVHGRLDVSSPLDVPWNIARSWPGCQFVIIDQAGHGAGNGIGEAVVAATDRFARTGAAGKAT